MNRSSKYSGYTDDFHELVDRLDFSALRNSSICITGATGMIGLCLLQFLQFLNSAEGYKIAITAVVRSKDRLCEQYSGDANIVVMPIEHFSLLDSHTGSFDYIFHAASPASPKKYVEDPVGTMNAIIDGTRAVLDYGKKYQSTRIVYVSTVEVIGDVKGLADTDEVTGVVDISSVRSSYPEAKRVVELYCHSYISQYDCNVVVARPAKIYGIYNHPHDDRIIAVMQRCAERREDISLRSRSGAEFSMCYVVDVVSALLYSAIHGKTGGVYTIAHPESFISIPKFAEKFAKKAGISVVCDDGDTARFAKNATGVRFRADRLRELGWQPFTAIDQGIDKLLKGGV